MILSFDPIKLAERGRCELRDEDGRLVYWGIYDFAYKHRTRIYNSEGFEVAYVQKDISLEEAHVDFCDSEDHKIGALIKNNDTLIIQPEGYSYKGDYHKGEIEGLMKIEEGKLEVNDDVLKGIMIMFALVEIDR